MRCFSRPFLLRRLFDLSALLCLWFAFQWRADFCCFHHGRFGTLPLWKQEFMVLYDRGDWHAGMVTHKTELFGGFIPRGFRCTYYDETFPFRYMRATDGQASQWLIAVPLFPLLFVSATVLGIRSVRTVREDVPRYLASLRARRQRREALRIWHGQRICRGCGYDLRATPDRCPECGRVPARAAPPTSAASLPASPTRRPACTRRDR